MLKPSISARSAQKSTDEIMSDHQRETAFLRECILYDDTGERHELEESCSTGSRRKIIPI